MEDLSILQRYGLVWIWDEMNNRVRCILIILRPKPTLEVLLSLERSAGGFHLRLHVRIVLKLWYFVMELVVCKLLGHKNHLRRAVFSNPLAMNSWNRVLDWFLVHVDVSARRGTPGFVCLH